MPCDTMDCVSMFDIPEIPVTQLPDDFTDEPGRLMLDVREYDEWEAGTCVALSTSRSPRSPPASTRSTPTPNCSSSVAPAGGRSERVLQYLLRNGYDGSGVAGGMLSWVPSGKPVESGR